MTTNYFLTEHIVNQSFKSSVYTVLLLALLMPIAGCNGDKKSSETMTKSSGGAGVVEISYIMATVADNELPTVAAQRHTPGAEKRSSVATRQDQEDYFIELLRNGKGVAYVAAFEGKTRVVFNGKPGKLYEDIDVYSLAVSPDGRRIAYGAKSGDKWIVVIDGYEAGRFDELGPMVFSPDTKQVAFEGRIGKRWQIILGNSRSVDVDSYYNKPFFSADSQWLVLTENSDTKKGTGSRIAVCDTKFTTMKYIECGGSLVNTQGTRVAVIKDVNGKKMVSEFEISKPDVLKDGKQFDTVTNLQFSADGLITAYIATRGEKSYIVMDGREELLPVGSYPSGFVISPDKSFIGIPIVEKENSTYLHFAFVNTKYTPQRYKEVGDVVFSWDGRQYAYVAIKNEQFFIVLNGKNGQVFDRVISPMFSPDGKYLVYRARQNGRRFVVVADALSGNILKKHDGHDRVFETTFTMNGKSVAYGVMDGKQISWKVESL